MTIKDLRHELIINFLGKEFNKEKIEKHLKNLNVECVIIKSNCIPECDYILYSNLDKNILIRTSVEFHCIEDLWIEE